MKIYGVIVLAILMAREIFTCEQLVILETHVTVISQMFLPCSNFIFAKFCGKKSHLNSTCEGVFSKPNCDPLLLTATLYFLRGARGSVFGTVVVKIEGTRGYIIIKSPACALPYTVPSTVYVVIF